MCRRPRSICACPARDRAARTLQHADLVGHDRDEEDIARLYGAQAMYLPQERSAPKALYGEGAGIIAKVQRQDRPEARVEQHLDKALHHLARSFRFASKEGMAGRSVTYDEPDRDASDGGEEDGRGEHATPPDGLRSPG